MTIVKLFGEVDTTKSLTELEGKDWGEPGLDSYLLQTCYNLRYKPLKYFEIEELRLMVDQDVGLQYLLPIALEKLEADPLVRGKQFKGDLLCSVLCADPKFYRRNPHLRQRVERVVAAALAAKNLLPAQELRLFEEEFDDAMEAFAGED